MLGINMSNCHNMSKRIEIYNNDLKFNSILTCRLGIIRSASTLITVALCISSGSEEKYASDSAADNFVTLPSIRIYLKKELYRRRIIVKI